jgi:4-amino-4-deoxy-L-arabinose transferase-like glycosyltransferase
MRSRADHLAESEGTPALRPAHDTGRCHSFRPPLPYVQAGPAIRQLPAVPAHLLALGLVLFGLGLRLGYALQPEAFVDEPTTLLVAESIARSGLPLLPSGVFYGNDLPYSYLVGGLVALVGPGLLAVRLVSVAASVLTMILVYLMARRLWSSWTGLWAAALLALTPEAILWGGRARAYGLLGLLVFAAAAAFYSGLAAGRPGLRRLGLVLLVVGTFVHPEAALLFPAFVAGGLAVQCWRRWLAGRLLAELALAALALAARYGLQLAIARGLVGGFDTVAGSRPPVQLASDLLARMQSTLPFFLETSRWPLALLAVAALVAAAWRLRRRRGDATRDRAVLFFSACLWLVPLQLVLVLGSTYQGTRYLNLLLPILALLAARGLEEVVLLAVALTPGRRQTGGMAGQDVQERLAAAPRSWTAALAALVLVVLLAALLPGALAASRTREKGYRIAFGVVERGWQRGDRVATVAPASAQYFLGRNDYFALGLDYEEFAYRDAHGRLVDRWLGSPLLRSARDLEAALVASDRLWLVVDEARFRQRFEPAFVHLVWDRMELQGYDAGVLVFRSFPAQESAVSQQTTALFGRALYLDGYDLGSPGNRPATVGQGQLVVAAGEDLRVTLHWRAGRPLAGSLHVFVHIVGQDGQRFAPADGPPLAGVDGVLPLAHWPVGETLPDRRLLPLPEGLAPGLYRLEVGLYEPSDGDRLPLLAAEGRELGGALILDYFRVPGPAGAALPIPSHASDVDLAGEGDRVRLLGYDLEAGPVAAGSSLELVLYWQAARRVEADYTVFIHLLDGEGHIWGQGDGRPLEGFYPTGLWDPGEVVVDGHRVVVHPGAPPGVYRLAVGLYHLPTGRRLAAANDEYLILGEVEVR